MQLLTFDIGVKTGWAAGAIGGKLSGGTRRLAPSGSEHGKVAGEQLQFIGDMIAMHRPDRVGFEFSTQTIAGKQGSGFTNIDTILMQAGIVTTRRGGGGGAVLARAPGDIRLGEVVRLLEAGQPLVECFQASGGDCSITGCCRLKARLRNAEAAFLADLDRSTLADLALPPLERALPA